MNEETRQFEMRLSRQPLRRIPAEWRAEVLAVTGQELRPAGRKRQQRWPSGVLSGLSSLFWPCPQAWAGLAAVWMLILTVDFSVRDKTPALAENSAPPSPVEILQLERQQRLLAELMGPREPSDADRSKLLPSRQHGECVEFLRA
ncbi:MAG: hypothetical protein KGR98_09475 [Verrucomicrobia bacterium]|nr:hypothetical protein [Verrucomicrobiota bacterium]MDE3099922.1 hypothetical protein [Verrucomicrobiota bacterium]